MWNEDHVTLVKRCGLDKKSRVRGIKVRRVETRGAVKGLGCEGPRKGGSFAHSRVSESRPGPASLIEHLNAATSVIALPRTGGRFGRGRGRGTPTGRGLGNGRNHNASPTVLMRCGRVPPSCESGWRYSQLPQLWQSECPVSQISDPLVNSKAPRAKWSRNLPASMIATPTHVQRKPTITRQIGAQPSKGPSGGWLYWDSELWR